MVSDVGNKQMEHFANMSCRTSRTKSNVIILGSFSRSHLGDVLCLSPLPRLLTEYRQAKVVISLQPNSKGVFRNNPYVVGFTKAATIMPGSSATGHGHILQRFIQGLELPLDAIPKPEIYLDDGERKWALRQRLTWRSDRPVCLLACGALSDRANTERVDWKRIAAVLSRRFTVVQPVFAEAGIDGAITYTSLSLRRFIALFSVVDFFVGGTSGGSHVAAAFNVPSAVVIWRSLMGELSFPTPGVHQVLPNLAFKASFLYPQHWFICAEDVSLSTFNEACIDSVLDAMVRHGRSGRPNPISNHPRWSWGFAPQAPPSVGQSASGRFVRIPQVYHGAR